MRLQSKLQTAFSSKKKTKNIDGAVTFPNKHWFQLHTSTISSVEPRGMTLEREDGWMTTKFGELYPLHWS